MIQINCPEQFAKAVECAVNNSCLAQFMKNIERLAGYRDGKQYYTSILIADRAPHSFLFTVMRPDNTRWISGGLIYSGPGLPLAGSGPVSNGLNSFKHHWSIHT